MEAGDSAPDSILSGGKGKLFGQETHVRGKMRTNGSSAGLRVRRSSEDSGSSPGRRLDHAPVSISLRIVVSHRRASSPLVIP